MEVFKVVTRVADKFYPAMVGRDCGPFFLEYAPGVKTYPPKEYPVALPYAFVSLAMAHDFIVGEEGMSFLEIWLAEAGLVLPDPKSTGLVPELMESMWLDKPGALRWTSPKGSVACDYIELVSRVWP